MKKALATIALVAAAALTLAGCSIPKATLEEEPTLPPAAQAEKDAREASPEPTPEPAPAPKIGTLANPGPVGSAIDSTGYDGTTYSTVFGTPISPANDVIANANRFNDAAPAGYHWVILPLTITNTSADASKGVRPGSAALDISLVDEATGMSYSSEFGVVLPNSISGQNEIYPGQVASGEIAYLIPDTAGALLAASGGVFIRL